MAGRRPGRQPQPSGPCSSPPPWPSSPWRQWRRSRPEELVLGVLACLVGLTTVVVAVDRSWPHAAAGAAAAYGLVAVGYAALPHRRAVVTLAVVALTSAAWLELAHADVTTLEAWTLPLAALLLAAGLWSHRELRRPHRG